MPTNLHSKYVSCWTEVLHGKLQPQFPNEFGELSGIPTGEKHVVHVDDEEDGRPVLCCFGEEVVVLIALGEADRLDEVVELLVPLSRCMFMPYDSS